VSAGFKTVLVVVLGGTLLTLAGIVAHPEAQAEAAFIGAGLTVLAAGFLYAAADGKW
jgi:hypothetical protein